MDTRGSEKQLTSSYKLSEPVVCAIYPTCALIVWDRPCSVNNPADVDRMQWTYTVEWSTIHSVRKQFYSAKTNFCHAIIEIIYPNEIICVRISARESTTHEDVLYASCKCTIDPSKTIPMPWLHGDSLKCRCIFDALLLCENGLHSLEAMPVTERGGGTSTVLPVRMLESTFACMIVKTHYKEPPLPITSSIVYYFVICSKSLVRQRERLRYRGIQEMLEKDGASAVFCGIGELGSSAALTAHLFLSASSKMPDDVRERVFCIAFGAPRRLFFEDSLILATSSPYSGNFLYYTGLLMAADRSSGYANSIFPLDPKEGLRNENGIHFNVPLGVRCGPFFDATDGSCCLRARSSCIETLLDEECHERLNVSEHLCILSRMFSPQNEEDILAPSIETITHVIEDGFVVSLTIKGLNLQYTPHMCVTSSKGCPAIVSITSITPREIRANFSLVELIDLELSLRPKQQKRVRVDLALLTDMGYTTFGDYHVSLPEDVMLLLFRDSRRGALNSWLFSRPTDLIDNAITVEAFLAGRPAKEIHKKTSELFASAHLLCSVAEIGEIAKYYGGKKQSGGIFSFLHNIAAKVSNSGTQEMTPLSIQITPMRESAVLENALEEYTSSKKKKSLFTLRSKLASWTQRLYHNLSWLNDTKYIDKVHTLLKFFGKTPPTRDWPLISLEITLWTCVVRYLRDIRGVSNITHYVSLDRVMQFEAFYQHMHPLFLSAMRAGENVAIEIVLEASALWSVCLIFNLRCSYMFTHIVTVTGCTGSGCSTMCNTLRYLSLHQDHYLKESQRVRNVIIRRAEESELDDLKEILILGVSATVFVVGELSDIKGLGFRATLGSVRRSRKDKIRQRVVPVLSKVDEQMCFCETTSCEEVGSDAAVNVARGVIVAAAGANVPNQLLAVSFAPSVALMETSSFVQRIGVSAEIFAKKLQEASISDIRKILSRVTN